jgi:hypothetical protein
MHISPVAQRVLNLVFAQSAAQAPLNRPRLERHSRLPRAELNAALAELEQRGLIDAQRLRLTLPGLAVAVATGARATRKARSVARKARRKPAVSAPIALFSQREAPRAVA